jgi:virulence-associated protein VapD
MYAMTFDFDPELLRNTYSRDSFAGCESDFFEFFVEEYANTDVCKLLVDEFGFERAEGSIFYGGSGVGCVSCVIAVQELANRYYWFRHSIREIRMLRIEENISLMSAFVLSSSNKTEAVIV